MSPAKKPSPTLPAKGSRPDAQAGHTCLRCPACGTECCNILQELGMYCETAQAASEAPKPRRRTRAAA